MVVCVLSPRFELVAALGGERRALISEPVALAPEAGAEQAVGEVSAAAEAFGVARGMRLGEALARCPELRLVPPDPLRVRELWNGVLDRLEGIGAAVESDRAGMAFFTAGGIEGIHGGGLEGVLAAARRAVAGGVRMGAAPSRFAAYATALRTRPRSRRAGVVREREARAFLAPLPVALLRTRPELQALPEVLERLGIRTLGELAELPPRAVAERFGHPGLLALDLARGRDTPLEPRRPPEPVGERLDLPGGGLGPAARARARAAPRACSRARSGADARCGRSRSRPASWPGAPGAGRSRCAARAPTRRGSARRCCRGWPSCRRRPSNWHSRSRPSGRPPTSRAA